MVARAGLEGMPREYLRKGGVWPAGPFKRSAPVTVLYAAEIAQRLRVGIDALGWSNTTAAERIGVSRQSLQRVLAGDVIPDVHTLARAESVLGARLWPETDVRGT